MLAIQLFIMHYVKFVSSVQQDKVASKRLPLYCMM